MTDPIVGGRLSPALSNEIWIRCEHCGLPHPRSSKRCAATGRPLGTRKISRRVPELPRLPQTADEELPRLPGTGQLDEITASHTVDRVLSAAAPNRARGTARAIHPGDVLEGKYEVLRLVGSGAMGKVYECRHRLLNKRVAVKVLHASTAANPVLMQRFRREARVAGALGHPNICRVFDLGATPDSVPFIVLEYLVGESLAARLAREESMTFRDALTIAIQVLSALSSAHEAGVVHRDIKPANVFLVSAEGSNASAAKLIDFGISKASSELTQLTRIGNIVGTPAYMAPEQTDGGAIDHRVDIYATGVLMYECLGGRRPFEAKRLEELVERVRRGLFPSLRLLRPDIPPAIEHVVLHAMQPRASKRPSSAREMMLRLSEILVALPAEDDPPVSSIPRSIEIEIHDDDDETEVRSPRL